MVCMIFQDFSEMFSKEKALSSSFTHSLWGIFASQVLSYLMFQLCFHGPHQEHKVKTIIRLLCNNMLTTSHKIVARTPLQLHLSLTPHECTAWISLWHGRSVILNFEELVLHCLYANIDKYLKPKSYVKQRPLPLIYMWRSQNISYPFRHEEVHINGIFLLN